ADKDTPTGRALLYIIAYDQNCNLIIGSTATEIISPDTSFLYMPPVENEMIRDTPLLTCKPSMIHESILLITKSGVYDYTIPVKIGLEHVGFIRVGISGQLFGQDFTVIVKKASVVLLGILLVSLVFSRIITLRIIEPILRLRDAVDKVNRRNWDSPIPVKGFDEISKLNHAFKQMALILKEREVPIEAGGIYNWFLIHGAPLLIPDAQDDFRLDSDLMKSLEIRSMIVVPLWSSDTLTGLLTAINKKGGMCFDKHDLRLFTVFSCLVAAALQNASLYSDLTEKIKQINAAQGQRVHSTKMAAIGELSTNLAHEINNP